MHTFLSNCKPQSLQFAHKTSFFKYCCQILSYFVLLHQCHKVGYTTENGLKVLGRVGVPPVLGKCYWQLKPGETLKIHGSSVVNLLGSTPLLSFPFFFGGVGWRGAG